MKGQHRKRRLGDQLFEAFDAACHAENACLAFCLLEALMIELSDREGDRRHPQWKVDLIVQATLKDITRPLPGHRRPKREDADLISFPLSKSRRPGQPAVGSMAHGQSYR